MVAVPTGAVLENRPGAFTFRYSIRPGTPAATKSMARSLGASTASSTTTRLIGTRPVVLDSAVNTSVEGWGGGGAVRREFGSGMSGLSGEGYGGTVHPN